MVNSALPTEHEAGIGESVRDGRQAIRFLVTIRTCAALVAAVACIVLAGWVLGLPEMTRLGSSNIPMAPSTAVLLLFSAIALQLRVGLRHRRAGLAGLVINMAIMATATLLFVLSGQGIHPQAEHLGFNITTPPGTIPQGHMSPVTAFCFLLAAVSYLASHTFSTFRPWRTCCALLLACLLMLVNFLFVLGYVYGEPFFYGGSFIPPALPTCLAFLILGSALLALTAQHAPLSRNLADSVSRSSSRFILMFTLLAAGIAIAGFLYFRSFEKTYRSGVENQLATIGDLKASELKEWRKDRLEHGSIISRIEVISALFRRAYYQGADPESRRLLTGWLGTYRDSLHYDEIRLLDASGTTLMALPDNMPHTCSEMKKGVAEVFRSQQVTLVDFYRCDHDGKVYLAILVPVRDEQDEKRVIGVITLRINPETYLYPFIKLWPVPSKTAETLLVRRDGTDVLFLNQLRFQPDAALTYRIKLEKTEIASVKAVLGQSGIVEGRDYRGTPTIAYVRAIPDSPWFLVSKIDSTEVYAPLRERLWLTIIFVGVVLLGGGLGIVLTWRQQRVMFYKEKLHAVESLRESEERFRLAIEESPFPVMIHAEDGTVLSLSRAWTEISGYGLSDIPTIAAWKFKAYGSIHAEDDGESKVVNFLQQRVSEGEFVVTCRDGSRRIWDFSSMSIGQLPDGRRMAISMAADVTDRKEKEKELARKNAELERYSYTVSHDLKSPLITIRSFSGAIKRDLAAGRQDRLAGDLGRIEAASAKMAELLDDLLELSRIGNTLHSPEPVVLNDLVMDVLASLSGPILENRIKVTVQPDLPKVFCDRQRMAEVVQNLLENAIKYRGDQQAPHIAIGVRQERDGHVFYVQDNGIGIDPKYHENIFGLFNKLDARSAGSGIGLALVKRIVEMHGGSVWVESHGSGSGATFCFTLAGNTLI